MSIQAKFYALQCENQELMMQLTELRNAFDLNRDVLNILSSKSDPSIRHFYVMLKKLNEHIIDLADNQFKARKERYKKIEEYNELELKYSNAHEQILALRQTQQLLLKQNIDPHQKSIQQQRDNFVITPKQSHFFLMEKILSISDELHEMRNTNAMIKSENSRLILQNNHLKQQLKYENKSDYKSEHKTQKPDPPKRKRYQQRVEELDQQEQEEQEEEVVYNGNRTQEIIGSSLTSRQKKSPIRKTEKKPENDKKKSKQLENGFDYKIQEIEELKRAKLQLQYRLDLLLGVQKRLLEQSTRKMSRQDRNRQQCELINMVQWRFQMQVLENPLILKDIHWHPDQLNKSI